MKTLSSVFAVSLLALATGAAIAQQPQSSAVAMNVQGRLSTLPASKLPRADADQFTVIGVKAGNAGASTVRLSRQYRGLDVIGGDIAVRTHRDGSIANVSTTLRSSARPASIVPKISADRAVVIAGSGFNASLASLPKATLVVYARAPYRDNQRLAWKVNVSGRGAQGVEADETVIIDASDGRELARWSNIQNAGAGAGVPDPGCSKGTAAVGSAATWRLGDVRLDTSKCGNTYKMIDRTRGGGTTNNMAWDVNGSGVTFTDVDNRWGNHARSDPASSGAEAAYGIAATWDYYLTVHDRRGIADDGKGALSRVHYGRNFSNASWYDGCFCMTFGDGNPASEYPFTVLDVLGHEMSHGVTSRTAALAYVGESGGLNEATSDIFGTMVEFFTNNPTDKPDYLLGERLFRANDSLAAGAMPEAIRYMFKPSLDGRSPDCYSPAIGDLNVHFSSGVANHFFYLLAEGSVVPDGFGAGTQANLKPADLVCAGSSQLNGIGRGKADRIWYAALTNYLTSDSGYADARQASLQAANDLYGANSVESRAVAAAWSAVLVN